MIYLASLVTQRVKNPSIIQETWVQSLCWEDPLEKEMALTEEPSGLQSMALQNWTGLSN